MKKLLTLALASTLLTACANNEQPAEITLTQDIKFDALNPARGDKSPMAGDVWGNRKAEGATGFIFKPTDGFSSPPHIHNVSYRGVVISGLVHNDDANAENQWMPAGSFWTQPKGHVHITSAKGENTMAYIEIDEGPYLVMPPEEEFHSGEVAINVDETNVIWLDESNIKWVKNGDAQVAFLWGDANKDKLRGYLLRVPANFKGKIKTTANEFRAILAKGELKHTDSKQLLKPGSYFSSTGNKAHQIECTASSECIVYIRTNDKFNIK